MTEVTRLPYPGLRSFRRDETDLFFGREGTVHAMVSRLSRGRFLAVLGSSGSGKSSLVRTGLFDALEIGLMADAGPRWRIVELRPGADPIENLAAALMADGSDTSEQARGLMTAFLLRGPRAIIEWCQDGHLPPGENLLLYIDQFEELFRFDSWVSRERAEAFVALLLEARSTPDLPIYVALSMRSEYLGAAALLRGLPEALNAGQFLTPRLTRVQCEEAILGPAGVGGFAIEPELVSALLNDLEGFAPWDELRGSADPAGQLDRLARQADQLPLLQHALNWLWLRASSTEKPLVLRLADYRAIGGLPGALDRHADDVLDAAMRRLGRPSDAPARIFRALVSGQTVADAVRRPTRMRELVSLADGDADAAQVLVEAFRAPGCNFLLPQEPTPLGPETWVDISHESLIRQWRQYSDWVVTEANAVRRWVRLVDQAKEHRFSGGPLLGRPQLKAAMEWQKSEKPIEAWAARLGPIDDWQAVQVFLRKSRQQRWITIGGIAMGVGVFAAFAGWFLNDRWDSQQRLTAAREETVRRNSDALAAARELFGSTLVGERQARAEWNAAGGLLSGLLQAAGGSDVSVFENLNETLIAQHAFANMRRRSFDIRRVSTFQSEELADELLRVRPETLRTMPLRVLVPIEDDIEDRYKPLSAYYSASCSAWDCQIIDSITGKNADYNLNSPGRAIAERIPAFVLMMPANADSWMAGRSSGSRQVVFMNGRAARRLGPSLPEFFGTSQVIAMTASATVRTPFPMILPGDVGQWSQETVSINATENVENRPLLLADERANQAVEVGDTYLRWAGLDHGGVFSLASSSSGHPQLMQGLAGRPSPLAMRQGRVLLAGRGRVQPSGETAEPPQRRDRGVGVLELLLGAESAARWIVRPSLLHEVIGGAEEGHAILALYLPEDRCDAGGGSISLETLADVPPAVPLPSGLVCLVDVDAGTGEARILGTSVIASNLPGMVLSGTDGTSYLVRFEDRRIPLRPVTAQIVGSPGPSPQMAWRPTTEVLMGGVALDGRPGERLKELRVVGSSVYALWQSGESLQLERARYRLSTSSLSFGRDSTTLAEFDSSTFFDVHPDPALADLPPLEAAQEISDEAIEEAFENSRRSELNLLSRIIAARRRMEMFSLDVAAPIPHPYSGWVPTPTLRALGWLAQGRLLLARGGEVRAPTLPEQRLRACAATAAARTEPVIFVSLSPAGQGGGRDWLWGATHAHGTILMGFRDQTWAENEPVEIACLPAGSRGVPAWGPDWPDGWALTIDAAGQATPFPLPGPRPGTAAPSGRFIPPSTDTRDATREASELEAVAAVDVLNHRTLLSSELGLLAMDGDGSLAIRPMVGGSPGPASHAGRGRLPIWSQIFPRGRRILASDAGGRRLTLLEAAEGSLRVLAAGEISLEGAWPSNAILGLDADGETILAVSQGAAVRFRLPRVPEPAGLNQLILAREYPSSRDDQLIVAAARRLLLGGNTTPVPSAIPSCAASLDSLLAGGWDGRNARSATPRCDARQDPQQAWGWRDWVVRRLAEAPDDAWSWPMSITLSAALSGDAAARQVLAALIRRGGSSMPDQLLAELWPASSNGTQGMLAAWRSAPDAALENAAGDGSPAALFVLGERMARNAKHPAGRAGAFIRFSRAEAAAASAGMNELAETAGRRRAEVARLLPDSILLRAVADARDWRPNARPASVTANAPAVTRIADDLQRLRAVAESGPPPPWVALLRLHLAVMGVEIEHGSGNAREVDAAIDGSSSSAPNQLIGLLPEMHGRLRRAGREDAAEKLLRVGFEIVEGQPGQGTESGRISDSLMNTSRQVLALVAQEQRRGIALDLLPRPGFHGAILRNLNQTGREEVVRDRAPVAMLRRRDALISAALSRQPDNASLQIARLESQLFQLHAGWARDEVALFTQAELDFATLRDAGQAPLSLRLLMAQAVLRRYDQDGRRDTALLRRAADDLRAVPAAETDAAMARDRWNLISQLGSRLVDDLMRSVASAEPDPTVARDVLLGIIRFSAWEDRSLQPDNPQDPLATKVISHAAAAWAMAWHRLQADGVTNDRCLGVASDPFDPDRRAPGRPLADVDLDIAQQSADVCGAITDQTTPETLFAQGRLAERRNDRAERDRLLQLAAERGHRRAMLQISQTFSAEPGSDLAAAERTLGYGVPEPESDLAAAKRALADGVLASILRDGYEQASALVRPQLRTESDRNAFAVFTTEAARAGAPAAHLQLARSAETPTTAVTHLLLAAKRYRAMGNASAAANVEAEAARHALSREEQERAVVDVGAWPDPPSAALELLLSRVRALVPDNRPYRRNRDGSITF